MKRLLQEMMIGEGGEVGKRWLKCLTGTGYTQFPDSAPPPKRQFRFHEAGNLDQRPDPAAGVVGDKGHFCIRRFCINPCHDSQIGLFRGCFAISTGSPLTKYFPHWC